MSIPIKPKRAGEWFEWFQKCQLSVIAQGVHIGVPEDIIINAMRSPVLDHDRTIAEKRMFKAPVEDKPAKKSAVQDLISKSTRRTKK